MRNRFVPATFAFLAIGWLAWGVAGHRLASLAASRMSGSIARLARGKVADLSVLVFWRMFDLLWLVTILVLLVLVFIRLGFWFRRRASAQRWIWQSLLVFFLLNIWIGAAAQRVLFWAVLYQGQDSRDYTQFQVKKTLAAEPPPLPRAILIGSSQVSAQIDEAILNQELSNRLWTAELHFPGSAALDIALVSRHLRRIPADFFICYVSEATFFSSPPYTSLPYFTTFSDLPWFHATGASEIYRQRGFYIGLLGAASPLFRCRESIAQRLLGKTFTNLPQNQYFHSLESNLAKRAEETLPGIKSTPHSELQKRAFNAFLQEAAGQHRRVIVLVGQFNPVLGERLDPALRREMIDFLHDMARKHPHLTLLENASFLHNPADDYSDLTHVSEDAQKRCSLAFAAWLRSDYLKTGSR